jgi:hypothetical protein
MEKFSQIAYLGYLNQYSKQELIDRLVDFQVTIVSEHAEGQIIRFKGEETRIDIMYTHEGKFIKIVEEEWFDCSMLFKRR